MSVADISFPDRAENQKETARLEAFSDGVFAIAITLLVLELKVPHLGEEASNHALFEAVTRQWPAYLALVTSFITILIMWVNHHGMFCHLQRVSAPLMFTNGLLLLLVTVVPFPTALVSDYFATPAGPAACAVYSGLFVLLAIAFNLLWWVARRDGDLLHPESEAAERDRITRAYAMGPVVYLLALGGAFVSVYLSIGICTALWVFWIALMRRL